MQILFGPGYRGIFAEIAEFADAADAVFASFFSERELAEDRKISNRETLRRKRVGRWGLKLLALSSTPLFSRSVEFEPLFRRPSRAADVANKTESNDATCLTANVFVDADAFSPARPFFQNLRRAFQELSVLSRDENGRGTPPRCVATDATTFWRDRSATRFGYTISHSNDRVLVVQSETLDVGCDLTPCGSATSALRQLFFTEPERRLLNERIATIPFLADAIWALKEAGYKANRAPVPFAPLRFEVRPTASAKRELDLEIAFESRILRPVRLEITNEVVLTVVISSSCVASQSLRQSPSAARDAQRETPNIIPPPPIKQPLPLDIRFT